MTNWYGRKVGDVVEVRVERQLVRAEIVEFHRVLATVRVIDGPLTGERLMRSTHDLFDPEAEESS